MIILGLGSNMGDRFKNLEEALHLLEIRSAVKIIAVSNIYETAPFGVFDQPDFFNMVARVKTKLTPDELLRECLLVENLMGRIRTQPWGPRIIDIDLLLYDEINLLSPGLTLPHPGIIERGFVIIPLADISPEIILANGQTVAALADDFMADKPDEVRFWRKIRWESDKKGFV